MVIRHKMYPYPVLAEFLDDYVDSKFDVTVEEAVHGYDRRLYFNVTLKNEGLQQLIKEEKAYYAYHLECAQTGFRKAVTTREKISDIIISHKEVCGKLQICPLLVAAKDIERYSNSAFHSDYGGISFNIEAGCVLAIAPPREIVITKEIDDLVKIPSIFSIVPVYDESITYMTVETSQPRIIIQLPLADFRKYSLLDQGMLMTETLNAMVIIPALIYTLDEVKRTNYSERYHYDDDGCVWYASLRKVLSEKFNCDIGSQEFDSSNTMELAQRLVEEPMRKALDTLLTLGATQNGDGN